MKIAILVCFGRDFTVISYWRVAILIGHYTSYSNLVVLVLQGSTIIQRYSLQ